MIEALARPFDAIHMIFVYLFHIAEAMMVVSDDVISPESDKTSSPNTGESNVQNFNCILYVMCT